VNQNLRQLLLKVNDSGFGCLLSFILISLLFGSVGLGWIVNGVLIFFALIIMVPVIAFFALRWWVQRNLVEDQCPVCNYSFTGFNDTECRCPSCGEVLQVTAGKFNRIAPPGTIDVEVVEVSSSTLDD
jgi:hypothetical protein